MKRNNEMIDLIDDIENIQTIKIILLIENSEWLNENASQFETLEELRAQVMLEYSKTIERIIDNIDKVSWKEILFYFKIRDNHDY